MNAMHIQSARKDALNRINERSVGLAAMRIPCLEVNPLPGGLALPSSLPMSLVNHF